MQPESTVLIPVRVGEEFIADAIESFLQQTISRCMPNALETAYSILESHPSTPAVYCDLMFVNTTRAPITARKYHCAGLVDASRLARHSVLQTRNLFGVPLLVRADALHGLRYDPSLRLALDLDLSIPIADGKTIYHVPEPSNRYPGANHTGMLWDRLVPEMLLIAQKNGILLNTRARAFMQFSRYWTRWLRRAFMLYASRTGAN